MKHSLYDGVPLVGHMHVSHGIYAITILFFVIKVGGRSQIHREKEYKTLQTFNLNTQVTKTYSLMGFII